MSIFGLTWMLLTYAVSRMGDSTRVVLMSTGLETTGIVCHDLIVTPETTLDCFTRCRNLRLTSKIPCLVFVTAIRHMVPRWGTLRGMERRTVDHS